jgi:large subunit ribosomal protein L4
MQLDILSLDGKKTGSVTLPANVFGLPVRADLLARAVNWQLANQRGGLANTQTRGEVDRTKKKVYAQKKTGGARHGAKSSNIFVGGGAAHGPRPRIIAPSLPKQVKALALKTALSSKASSQSIIVISDATLANHKTKELVSKLTKLNALNATFIVDSLEANFDRATRNIPHIKVLPTAGANVYDILHREKLVLTEQAVTLLVARLAAEESADKPAKAAKTVKPSKADVATVKAASAKAKPAAKAAAKKVKE